MFVGERNGGKSEMLLVVLQTDLLTCLVLLHLLETNPFCDLVVK